jgi:hypothetical protein
VPPAHGKVCIRLLHTASPKSYHPCSLAVCAFSIGSTQLPGKLDLLARACATTDCIIKNKTQFDWLSSPTHSAHLLQTLLVCRCNWAAPTSVLVGLSHDVCKGVMLLGPTRRALSAACSVLLGPRHSGAVLVLLESGVCSPDVIFAVLSPWPLFWHWPVPLCAFALLLCASSAVGKCPLLACAAFASIAKYAADGSF